MTLENNDAIRVSVLDRMERADRNLRLGIGGAVLVELGLFIFAFMMIDWDSRIERIVFVLAVLSYTVVVLGLFTLGAHVSKSAARVIAAVEDSTSR